MKNVSCVSADLGIASRDFTLRFGIVSFPAAAEAAAAVGLLLGGASVHSLSQTQRDFSAVIASAGARSARVSAFFRSGPSSVRTVFRNRQKIGKQNQKHICITFVDKSDPSLPRAHQSARPGRTTSFRIYIHEQTVANDVKVCIKWVRRYSREGT